MARNSSDRSKMTAQQKKAASLRKMGAAADNWASMGGRGPKKGTAEFNKRREQWKSNVKGAAKAYGAVAAANKAEKVKPPRKKAAVAKKGAPARRPKASKSLY